MSFLQYLRRWLAQCSILRNYVGGIYIFAEFADKYHESSGRSGAAHVVLFFDKFQVPRLLPR